MRAHSHEVVRRVLEAIDTADGTGQLDLPIDAPVLQHHLDLLYVAGLAEAIDDPPYTRLTDAGMELLIYTRDRDRWQRHTYRHPLGDDAGVLGALLFSLRRSEGAGQPADQKG